MSHTPLPRLHDQLVAAARALDATTAPRRRPRRRWAALGVIVALSGTGVAVARVAEIGPFAYLDRFGAETLPADATSVITVDAGGTAPRWLARATKQNGHVCITGGPRDPRTNPTKPSPTNNPPASSVTCTATDELALALVDPDWPGTYLASSTDLNGSLNGDEGRPKASGTIVRVGTPPSRTLVYAVAGVDGPKPVVRVGLNGSTRSMTPSDGTLTVRVNRSPQGLSSREQRLVASYPETLTIRLWAAEVPTPGEDGWDQVLDPSGVADPSTVEGTIVLVSGPELRTMFSTKRALFRARRSPLTRDPAPVDGPSASATRWIAAFARPHRATDAVTRPLTLNLRGHRAQPREARLLRTIGNAGSGRYWLLPGGLSGGMVPPRPMDVVCVIGAKRTPISDCKYDTKHWRSPLTETIACSPLLPATDALVWALAPPGATGAEVRYPNGRTLRYGPGELLLVQQRRDALPSRVRWLRAGRTALDAPVPQPALRGRCQPGSDVSTLALDSNRGSRSMGPRWSR